MTSKAKVVALERVSMNLGSHSSEWEEGYREMVPFGISEHVAVHPGLSKYDNRYRPNKVNPLGFARAEDDPSHGCNCEADNDEPPTLLHSI
jgi:hypothetical protein